MGRYGLNKVFFLLPEKEKMLEKELREEGIESFFHKREENKVDSSSLVITDDVGVLGRAERVGAVTIFLSNHLEFSMDLKADLILLDLNCLDLNTLYSTFCHVKGLPFQIGESDTLFLRELTYEDIDDFISITREEHNRMILSDGTGSKEEQREKLRSYISEVYRFFQFGIYGIFLKESDALIGAVSLDVKDSLGEPNYEIGFFLSYYYIGRGYGIMAVEILVDYAFRELGVERLVSITASSNKPAIKLLKKVGFVGEIKKDRFVSMLEGKMIKDKEMRNERDTQGSGNLA